MKGLSLPINIIVILAIVLLVLLAVASFFAGGFGSSAGSMSDAAALQEGCGMWRSRGCMVQTEFTISGYDPNGDGVDDTQLVACTRVLGDDIDTTITCHKYCCG